MTPLAGNIRWLEWRAVCWQEYGPVRCWEIFPKMVPLTASWTLPPQNTPKQILFSNQHWFQNYVKENASRVKSRVILFNWYFPVQVNLLFSLVNKPNDIKIIQDEKITVIFLASWQAASSSKLEMPDKSRRYSVKCDFKINYNFF